MPTILDGPQALWPLAGPLQRFEVARRGGRHGALAKCTAVVVDGHHCVAGLVCVGPECHHAQVSFRLGDDRTGRWTCLSWGETTLL
jgi:hypothetical protein